MNYFDPIHSQSFSQISPILNQSSQQSIDLTLAREAYINATDNALERHAEIGILRPNGLALEFRLGKDEQFGAHRVGSVTKTFTTFLALKLENKHIKLNKDGDKTFGLDTKCGDLIDENTLKEVFENPTAAKEMTLDQLLSHTSGLEYDDHNREGGGVNCKTIDARFRYEGQVGKKYKHTSLPGDRMGSYSNAGLAVASWMMEIVYNKYKEDYIPFSQIMKTEIFDEIFSLSEDTRISPDSTGDIIGSAAGDMTSSVKDLLTIGKFLQKGEGHFAHCFGSGWQQKMLAPRDLFKEHGIGCAANQPSIQHYGLNSEKYEDKIRDVTAVVIFPLGNEPGLVAMCDSNALATLPNQKAFANELKKLAEIETEDEKQEKYPPDFFCPSNENASVFKGNAYIVTDVNPFF